jgi:hypothetical protein
MCSARGAREDDTHLACVLHRPHRELLFIALRQKVELVDNQNIVAIKASSCEDLIEQLW